MPFATNASLTSTDLNNMWRGLYRDNSDHAVTGVTTETTMATLTITGNTIGSTGSLEITAAGTITGTAGSKTINLYLGATVIATITEASATTSNWTFRVVCANTSNSAQRWFVTRSTNDATTTTVAYTTSAIDTTQNQVLKITATLGNTGDTVTQSMFQVNVCQIT